MGLNSASYSIKQAEQCLLCLNLTRSIFACRCTVAAHLSSCRLRPSSHFGGERKIHAAKKLYEQHLDVSDVSFRKSPLKVAWVIFPHPDKRVGKTQRRNFSGSIKKRRR